MGMDAGKICCLCLFVAWWYVWPEPQVYSFKGKTVLVTGASSGIGIDIAKALADEGVSKLGICARRVDKLAKTKELLAQAYPDLYVEAFSCDIADSASREKLASDLLASFGHLDVRSPFLLL